jgi:hypothetical protein
VELVQLLNAGGVAGLAVGFSEPLFAIIFASWLQRELPANAETADGSRFPLQILLHLLTGVGIGLLFWLTWGFAAVNRVDWWARGLIFATALWAICIAPSVIQLRLQQNLSLRITFFTLLQRLYSLSIIALACAWTWSQG